jgi:NADH-quinone oxidoreductase subunit L
MTLPLIILGALSIGAGFVALHAVGKAIGLPGGLSELVFPAAEGPEEFTFNWGLAAASTAAGVGGLLFGIYMVSKPARIRAVTQRVPELVALVQNKYYFDNLYQAMVDYGFLPFARLISWFDRKVVNDTGVDGPSNLTDYAGNLLKFLQTGKLPNYALIIIVGLLVLAAVAFTTRA